MKLVGTKWISGDTAHRRITPAEGRIQNTTQHSIKHPERRPCGEDLWAWDPDLARLTGKLVGRQTVAPQRPACVRGSEAARPGPSSQGEVGHV